MLFGEPLGAWPVAFGEQCLQEPLVVRDRSELTRATQPQALIDRALELVMRGLDVTVLVGATRMVRRCPQSVVGEHLEVALVEATTARALQLVRRRRQVVRAVLSRNATQLPQTRLEPFDQRLAVRQLDRTPPLPRGDVRHERIQETAGVADEVDRGELGIEAGITPEVEPVHRDADRQTRPSVPAPGRRTA